MNSRVLLHELLVKACFESLGLSLNDKLQMVKDGAILKSNDYCTITIENPLLYENDRIDSVLVFGDGTIEFHLENECEALNWDDFDCDLIEKIIGIINHEIC